MTKVDRLTTVKLREAKRLGGTSGRGRVSIRIGTARVARAPMPRATQATGSCQSCCAPRVAPNASPPTPMATTAAPSQSNSPRASVSRLSGTSAVAHRAMAMSGTLIRNAARQLTAWTRKPPSRGPTIEVAEVPDAQRPMARPRASPSKAAVMIERLPGTSTAPNAA